MAEPKKKMLVIAPGMANKNYWRDIWSFRELFYILSWRDIKVRYKQTVIGAAWSVLRPLITTLIFVFVFNNVAKLDDKETTPYALVVFAGMIAWQFFSTALQDASNSLVGNAALISKVYFPRIIVPASSLITALVDFFVSFILLIIVMIWFRFFPGVKVLLLPFFIIVSMTAAFGLGLLFSALTVKYRDLRILVPFIIQFGLFISPVGYRSSIIDVRYQALYALNPMVGVIDGFRWALLDEPLNLQTVLLSLIVAILLLLSGITYFRKIEMKINDDL
jgi:lipopolysaccharide transport system permease protein